VYISGYVEENKCMSTPCGFEMQGLCLSKARLTTERALAELLLLDGYSRERGIKNISITG